MFDHFKSAQILANNELFLSLCILCRSTLDIIIQLKWILSLEILTQNKAIDYFLQFEGVGQDRRGKYIYEWQKLIASDFSYREVAISLGLDEEVININMQKIL